MWASSRSPALGLIGTTGTPATSAPTTAAQVSSAGTAHTATRGLAWIRPARWVATPVSSR